MVSQSITGWPKSEPSRFSDESEGYSLIYSGDIQHLEDAAFHLIRKTWHFFLRIYLPDNPDDFQGGVDLPTITEVNEVAGENIPCPAEVQDSPTADDIFVINYDGLNATLCPDDERYTYRPGNYGLFANGASPYPVTLLIRLFF